MTISTCDDFNMYGEELPSIDKKKVAVGKKVSKDDCCMC